MTDDASPLPAGPVPLTSGGLEIVQALGRVGDGLVYAGKDRTILARLREYAPAGILVRALDGSLEPADQSYAEARAEATAQFIALGRRLAGFSHPGVAPIWRTEGSHDGGAWWVGGPVGAPLRQALDAGVVFTPADVVRFAGELADVLAELHARGIAHLDIAPETVSVASGHVQLSDFAIDNRPFIALRHSHEGLVRPGYGAIEHYDAGIEEPLGPPADIHAASALVYRLAAGREPSPWQERWRNPDAAPLADRDDYPPGFLAAIRKGMAIEPGDRFANGAEWRAALNLPGKPAQVPAVVRERANPVVPVLAGLVLLAVALFGFLAWRFHWLGSDPITDKANVQVAGGGNVQQPPPERIAPLIRAGDSVQGELGADDATGPGGGYRDGYRLAGHRGDRVAIRLRPDGFEPVLSLFGPGLAGQQGENGRALTLTLPQDGTYTLLVGAARPGATGRYSLEVVPAIEPSPDPGPVDPAAARRLAGIWHDEEDDVCKTPAVNSVQGDTLTVRLGDDTYRHRIDSADTNEIDTTVEGGRLDGRTFHFQVAPDGRSYDMDGETWTRC